MKTNVGLKVVIHIWLSSVNHDHLVPSFMQHLVANAHSDAEITERVSLECSASSVGLFRSCGGRRVTVSLNAALGSTAARIGWAAANGAHGPASTNTLAEIVGARDAVNERHVVPDVSVDNTVLELHRLIASVSVELEG